MSLALRLCIARRQLGGDAAPELDRILAETVDELRLVVEELRELAHGVLPAILVEDGLATALESLRDRVPLLVAVDVCQARLPALIESTAYFVVSEALANVVKHARASKARITARARDGIFLIAVADDGVGGARVDGGSGLLGLADRVEAVGGRLEIESPRGAGTRITAAIPYRS